ncbi:MAG: GNAT family N-acetyltransferase [Chitinophagaceae bacterium]
MFLQELIVGKHIQLRSSSEADAAFILALRLDPTLNQYLNPTPPELSLQEEWIRKASARAGEYNFVIETKTGERLGVVSIYQIDDAVGTFNWGRWIIKPDAPMYTAIESTLLIYYLGFIVLGLETALSEVRTGNKTVIRFHQSYGVQILSEDELEIRYSYERAQFPALLKKFRGYHEFPLDGDLGHFVGLP